MGLTVALAGGKGQTWHDTDAKSQPTPTLPRWVAAGLVALVVVAVGMAIVLANVRPLLADVAARTADKQSLTGNLQEEAETRERVAALWPVEPAHRLSLSWTYLLIAQTSENPIDWLQRAEEELLAARDLRPDDFRIWAALGELYGVWGNFLDAEKLPHAHEAYQQATALAPNLAFVHTSWAMVDLNSGNFQRAADRLRRAVDLDATDGHAFRYLGDAELALGNVEGALGAYERAVYWQPGLSQAHLGLARCYWYLGERGAAELALAQVLELDPENVAAWALRQEMETGP
jgi:tetratricopeptide (TPR) repeat protein